MPLLINNEVAANVLGMQDCMDSLENVYKEEARGGAVSRNKSSIHMPTGDSNLWYRYVSMEGGSRKLRVVAVRIKSDMVFWKPVNAIHRELWYTSEVGKYGGLILLFSAESGELLAILNDGFIQHMRIVGTYALGAKYMSRRDTEVVGILGSGGMARGYLEALSLIRNLKRVKIFSPTPEHRDSYAREMRERLRLEIIPVGSIEEAARGVDHLAAMTDAIDPIIFPHLLGEGLHLCTVTAHEMSSEAYRYINRIVAHRTAISEHLFVTDERPRQLGGSHPRTAEWEFQVPVRPSFGDILLGRVPGRENDKEVTYFLTEGMGTQFVAVAAVVYRKAMEQGKGQELPLDWFLQDIRT
jgi:alanine dehydrogenase